MGRRIDLIGKKFGRLSVIELIGRNTSKKLVYLCECDCGNMVEAVGAELRNGHTQSCGCLRAEITKKKHTTHGLSHHKIRQVWRNMIARCENPDVIGYKNYGGRGITVCEEWHDLEVFAKWAFESGYSERLTIERKDVNGNYCPENCCWATMKVQCNNKRDNHYIEAFGENRTLSQWSDLSGISQSLIRYRLEKGLSMEQILNGEK